MPSSPASLVLGLITDLPPASITPFVTSLRGTGYRGRVGLVTAGYSADEIAGLREIAEIVVDVTADYDDVSGPTLDVLRWLRTHRRLRPMYRRAFNLTMRHGRERDGFARWAGYERALQGLQSLRYRHYYDVLQDQGRDADLVFLSDLRDVVFQGDPFARPLDGLEVFLEEPSVTLGADHFNATWFKQLFGEARRDAVAATVASCSGTVAGPRDEVLDYLGRMMEAIAWRRIPMGAHDQAVHNGLLTSGALPRADGVVNGTGRVLTMAALPNLLRSDAGEVLNADGSVPEVLHQYDRFPGLAAELHAVRKAKPRAAATDRR